MDGRIDWLSDVCLQPWTEPEQANIYLGDHPSEISITDVTNAEDNTRFNCHQQRLIAPRPSGLQDPDIPPRHIPPGHVPPDISPPG